MIKLNLTDNKGRRVLLCAILTALMIICPFVTLNINSGALASPDAGGIIYQDNFNQANAKIDGKNNWISKYAGTTPTTSHQIKNKLLYAEDFSNSNGACTCTTERPMSEATLNQRVTIDITNLNDIKNQATANIHLRVIHGTHSKNSDASYFAEVTNEYIRLARTTSKFTVAEITSGGEKTFYTIKKNHIYRVEFSAYGLCPTTLSATLYDVTDGNKAVATVTGNDDTAELQRMGTAALSCTKNGAGQNVAMFDNFKYETLNKSVFVDKFDRANGNVGNDWNAGSLAVANISNKTLQLKMASVQAPYNPHIEESALVRPLSEKSLNQLIEVEFKRPDNWADIGAVIIARAQSETVKADNCYRLVTHFAFDGANNWTEYMYLLNSSGEELFREKLQINPDTRCLLQLSVNSISETETLLVSTLYDVNNDYAPIYQNKTIDNDPNLQKAGTAGLSILDRWNGTLNIYSFSYVEPPEVKASQLYPQDDNVPVKFEDNFDGANGNINNYNGWIDQQALLNQTNFARVEDKTLVLDNGDMTDNGVFNYKLLRPMSEAALNQRVSVDLLNLDDIKYAQVSLRIIEIPSDFDKTALQSMYGIVIEKGKMVFCTDISWGQGEISGLEYEYEEGHIYRLVVTAQGSLPTKMVAKLYDLSDGEKLVATLTATDMNLATSDHRSGQLPGTVALSYAGEKPFKIDNFVYEQMDKKVCHDSFNRQNGAIGNDWVLGSKAGDTAIKSYKLIMDNGSTDNMWTARLMRPLSEKAAEQTVAVQFNCTNNGASVVSPIVFARAQTGTSVTVDSSDAFACYYAQLVYTGEWSAKLLIYKIDSAGNRTLLGEKATDIYGKSSNVSARIDLLAQGVNPTKLNAILTVVSDTKIYDIINLTVTDDQTELQQAGTAGISYSGTTGKFTVEKFSYLESPALPKDNPVPEDLEEKYMAYFTGTVAAGNFGQWVEVEPGKVYVYSVRLKKLLDSGGFGIRVSYNPVNWGRMYKEYMYNSIEIDENTCLHTCEFEVPADSQILANGKARIQVAVHEGGLSSTGYATDFKVYAKDDPNKTNLLVNPDFKKGFYGWAGHGYYIQGADVGGVLKTLGSQEVWLVPYDELAFVRDDSDIYFDDGDWASIFETDDELDVSSNGIIKGRLRNSSNKALKGVTVMLYPGMYETKTNKSGYFEFKDLPAEFYTLSILMKDGEECEFDEPLIIDDGTELELSLCYEGDEDLLDMSPGTGEKRIGAFAVFASVLPLAVLATVIHRKKFKKA